MALSDLSSTLLANHSHVQVEEWTKQGQALQFNSGKNQRIVSNTIPAIEMTISYKNLLQSDFEGLRTSFESSHSNTFELTNTSEETLEYIDPRRDHLGTANTSVWAFKEFKFKATANQRWTGTVKLITSVFFDFTEYQQAFTQSSTYSPVTTTDTTFTSLMANYAQPYQIDYEYMNNSIFSNIGQSARHIKDKGGLRKKWTLSWLLQQSDFLELLKYYRKRGGIMSKFGVPKLGFGTIGKTEAVFMTDSFKYDKRVDGMYSCKADIVEVL